MRLNPKALQNVIFQLLGWFVCLLISLNTGREINLVSFGVVHLASPVSLHVPPPLRFQIFLRKFGIHQEQVQDRNSYKALAIMWPCFSYL